MYGYIYTYIAYIYPYIIDKTIQGFPSPYCQKTPLKNC